MNEIVTIHYDDHLEDIPDKFNDVLELMGISFEDDGEDHDAFTVHELKVNIQQLEKWLSLNRSSYE